MIPPSRARRVLHVVDRVTGGVPVAVRTYIRHSPDGVDHVIASPHVDGVPASVWDDLPVEHVHWDTSTPVRALGSLRRLSRRSAVDVVHAHSSFPGAYVRLLRWPRAVRLVYTPHCFAFCRTDVSAPVRAAYRGVERLLAHRTTILAACGPGERRAAVAAGIPARRTLVVPNLASLAPRPAGGPPRQEPDTDLLRVGMLGRWSAQKDPGFFVRSVEDLRARLPRTRVEATWIGDGERAAPRGIRVTGWMPSADVRAELLDLDVYLHTAAWEGFPIALLDADAMGLPMLARPIAALVDLPRSLTLDAGLAALCEAIEGETFGAWRAANRAGWARYLGPRGAGDQRRALAAAWG